MSTLANPKDVLDFWFGTDEVIVANKRWFFVDSAFDDEILAKFGPTIDAALENSLPEPWAASSTDAFARIAHILLLDQFTRNVYRGTPKAFAGDPKAYELSRSALDSGMFDQNGLTEWHMVFALMPFQHTEDLEAQKQGIEAIKKYCPTLWADEKTLLKPSAEGHIVTIEKFGRFPHRNIVLGRQSTPQELEYLQASTHSWEKSTNKVNSTE